MGSRRRTTGSFEVRRTTGSASRSLLSSWFSRLRRSSEVVDRLFVYATLRQGQTARSLIANQIARAVKASTTGAMYAFPMGYAGLVEVSEPRRVVGELLWLTELPATFGLLDAYEGEEFVRVIKQVTLETGEPVWAWIYVLSDPEAIKHGTLIDHGDWVRYENERSKG